MLTRIRSFDRSVQLLLVNQLTINIGFYMLMPYLAGHLADDLGMAAWTIGLVLGMRNLCQQGLFLVGGTLADRIGYKPVIVAGCVLRTGGFALLGVVDTLPALLVARPRQYSPAPCSIRPYAPTSPTTPATGASRPSRCSTSSTRRESWPAR